LLIENMADKIAKIKESEMLDSSEEGSKGISYKTIGTTLQALSVQLDEGEMVYSESGKMSWMTANINMDTKSRGISKMFSRVITGETLFVNHFTATKGTGVVTFSTDQAGKIIPVDLDPDKPAVVFQRGAFLCAENNVDLSIAFTKRLSAGFFGGKGWILQKVSGKGRAHLISDGEVVMYELEKGQEIIVDQGNLVAYEQSVDFDIQTVSGGVKNWLFGGEGIFVAVLRGPGKVWLQTRKLTIYSAATNAYAAQSASRSGGMAQNPLGCIIGLAITGMILLCMFGGILLSLLE
jgi:uncharacterized protein (TIGR00266 family)